MLRIRDYFIKNKLNFFLLCAVILPLLFGSILPHLVKQFLFSISVSLKEIITFILPVMIFSFICSTLINVGKRAVLLMILLFGTIYLSNLTAIYLGYYVGAAAINHMTINQLENINFTSDLIPLWSLDPPSLINNESALIIGLLFGFVISFFNIERAKKHVTKLNEYSLYFLKNIFLPLLPIFIMGFIIKLDHDNIGEKIVTVFGSAILVIVSLQLSYTLMLFLISQGFNVRHTLKAIKNVLPASFTGFTSISSAASVPVNIICTEKNVRNPEIARAIIPITANIHTLGSALGITVLLMFIMHAFGFHIPAPYVFFNFAMIFAMSKFAVAGIPGGVIIVISPILETHLGFSPEMIGLITSLYLLIDPIGTSINVTCNSAFATIISKIVDAFSYGSSPRETPNPMAKKAASH